MSSTAPYRPLVLIAELTHRCPLRCAYCSNPEQLAAGSAELDTATWLDVLEQARELGVLQAHLTGGEPLLRADLVDIARGAATFGLYTTLVTSGLAAKTRPGLARLLDLAQAGVRSVQVSFQDVQSGPAVAVAGRDGLLEKLEFARRVREVGLSLTVNVVLHAANIQRTLEFVRLALDLGADRLELAHVQYHGWARRNRAQLLPSAEQVEASGKVVALAKLRHSAELDIVLVMPDHFSGRAKPCMGGWGQRALVVSPDGKVLPCHAADSLPFEHERVPGRRLADVWNDGAAFRAFRGEAWMEEPCRSCPERARDFGGCRCQALALAGRATAADPACSLSPEHGKVIELRRRASEPGERAPYVLRSHAPSQSQATEPRGGGRHVGE